MTNSPIPILLTAQQLTAGGSERQLTEIALALDRTRFHPHVACLRPGGARAEELRARGVEVVEFPVDSFRSLAALAQARRLARYLRENDIRLVHSFDTPSALFAAPTARLAGVRAVLASQRSHRDLLSPFYRRLMRVVDRIAHRVVVNCEAVRRHLIEDEGVPDARIRLCCNGLDANKFNAEGRRRPPGLPVDGLVVGVVCVLRPEKGLPTLLEAFARARIAAPELFLVVVGGGPLGEALKEQARSLDIEGAVRFEPVTPQPQLWLRGIDIFVLPSLSEAFSNALMEAMACGCAAVATRVGGNPELVRDGETGLLVEPGDAEALAATLVRLARAPELRARLAGRGAAFVGENFTIAAAARRMASIYEEMLAR